MQVRRHLCLVIFFAMLLWLMIVPQPIANAAKQVNFKNGRNGIVCLTIDDGYGSESVRQALNILRAKKVHCTFFVIGSRLKALPELWRQAVRDGHEICYHSMNHKTMSSWSNASIAGDVRQWNQTAKNVLGQGYQIPKFARLPGGGGHGSQRIQALFDSMGYKLIYWSADTYTGVIRNGTHNLNRRIADYIKSTTRVNSIILTHFNNYDVPAIPGYIDWLKSHFKLGRVSDAFMTVPVVSDLPKLPAEPLPKPPRICMAESS